ncbi:MAG: ABC transporter ATP-binding protein [Pseudomonadota bacterium]
MGEGGQGLTTPGADAPVLLDVHDIQTRFRTQDGMVHAVNGVSFTLAPGETLAVVGESGSGKSVTMMSLLKLLPMPPAEIVAGHALFEGRDLITLGDDAIRDVRGGQIGFIFQDPMTSLNPVLTVGYQVAEPLRRHLNLSKAKARERAVEMLELVGIPQAASRLGDYPHQFSGGMRQRVMIAIALACQPKILIADEPTTALDVTIQAQIVELVKELRQELGMAIVWITHDLGVVAGIADRVAVMYAGSIVEHAEVASLYARPQHPYTRALLETLPHVDEAGPTRLASIAGQPPDLLQSPRGCPFAPRCRHAYARCMVENPLLEAMDDGHEVACWWNADDDRPRYEY